MEQQTGSKSGTEFVKAVYCHPAYLIYTQSTSGEAEGWMKHKLELRLPREMSIIWDMQKEKGTTEDEMVEWHHWLNGHESEQALGGGKGQGSQISRWKYTALTYSFPYEETVCCSMSSSNYCFLTCILVSQEAGKVVWYCHLFKNFPQFVVSHTDKGLA